MQLENMRNELSTVSVSSDNQANYNLGDAVDVLVRAADQVSTVISDTFDYEVIF